MRKGIRHARGYLPKMGWLASFLLCLSGLLYGQEEGGRSSALPEGESKELVAAVCSTCHGLGTTQILRDGREGWREKVDRMILHGAQLSPEEADAIVQYLFTHFGPGSSPMRSGPLPPQTALGKGVKEASLPAGPGKDLVEARCVLCHELARVIHARRSRAEWAAVTKNMIERGGQQATPEQIETIVTYLGAHFGKETQ